MSLMHRFRTDFVHQDERNIPFNDEVIFVIVIVSSYMVTETYL